MRWLRRRTWKKWSGVNSAQLTVLVERAEAVADAATWNDLVNFLDEMEYMCGQRAKRARRLADKLWKTRPRMALALERAWGTHKAMEKMAAAQKQGAIQRALMER